MLARRSRFAVPSLGITVVAAAAIMAQVSGSVASADQTARTVRIMGEGRLKINQLIAFTFQFTPDVQTVTSGGTVTWVNETTPAEPHTVTIVRPDELPQTLDQVFNCRICNKILPMHFPEGGAPVPVLNVGKEGLNRVGDSLLVPPGGSVTATVSAPAGTVLNYMCVIHPWMQAELKVL